MSEKNLVNAPEYTHSRREIRGKDEDGNLLLGPKEALESNEVFNWRAIPFSALEWTLFHANARDDGEDKKVWQLRRETVQANREHGIVFR